MPPVSTGTEHNVQKSATL